MRANEITPTKVCTKCKTEKIRAGFGKRSRAKDGLFSECLACRSLASKRRYLANKEHIGRINTLWKKEHPTEHREMNRAYRVKNQEKIRESGKRYNKDHTGRRKETTRDWYCKNLERKKELVSRWKASNPGLIKIYRCKSGAKQRGTPQGRLNNTMSAGINSALRGRKRGRRWENLVGYGVGQLKKHLESLFSPGMTWENYGVVWEIDHKTPKAVFNFEEAEDIDFKACWCLENLRPLGKSENRKKYNKLDRPFQPSLMLREVENG
jgi:hypothetical protein